MTQSIQQINRLIVKRSVKDFFFINAGVIMAAIGLKSFLLPNHILGGHERYLTTQHERDEGTISDNTSGTGLDYRFARYSESDVPRFWSIDPAANEYPSMSPYSYVGGNPIMLIDPDGKRIDNYSVDGSGNLKLEEKTDDNFDMLYTKSDYDNGNLNNGLKLNDQSILPGLSSINGGMSKTTVGEGGANDLYSAFMFLANNTNVEWSVVQTSNQFTMGTYRESDRSPSPSSLGIDNSNVRSLIHNHPSANRSQEISSMGVFKQNGRTLAGGDWGNVRRATRSNGGTQPFYYYTYFPKSGNLYNVEYGGPRYIRNLGNNTNRLFFGTLK